MACVIAVLVSALGWPALARPLTPAAHPDANDPGQARFDALLAASTDLGPADPSASVEFTMTLRNDRGRVEEADLARLYDPTSPEFGQFRSDADIASRFGPDPDEVARLIVALKAAGLMADWRPGNAWLSVGGRAADVGRTFAVSFHRFQSRSSVDFIAALGPPVIPTAWRRLIRSVDTLSDYSRFRPSAVRAGGMTADDINGGYNMKPLRDLGIDGSGQTIVITVPADGYRQESLDAFTTRFGLPPIAPVNMADDPEQIEPVGELEMDLEVVHAIAPGARLVVYASKSSRVSVMTKIEDRAVNENPGAVISQSWGSCEPAASNATLDAHASIYARSAERGVTVFASSGDSGAYTCLTENKDWGSPPTDRRIGASLPSSVPFVTSVGGTRLSLRADGSYYHETVWSWPALTEASGGGPSSYYARPDWQTGPGVAAGDRRLTPDIAADAESGMAIFNTGIGWNAGGGTSLSAPILAGMTALINDYLKRQGLPPVGFLNLALYALAREPQPFPPFHDVVQGSNLLEPATVGHDTSTGLGSPDAWNLARDLEARMRAGGVP